MKSPKPPDPYQTAGAQQRSEIGAAGASSIMNNPNIINPYGSQSYSISGWEQVPDATGKMISVPDWKYKVAAAAMRHLPRPLLTAATRDMRARTGRDQHDRH